MVGLNVQEPETTCDDPNCPFHGTLPVRGQVLEGVVVSNKAERTITVERSYYKFMLLITLTGEVTDNILVVQLLFQDMHHQEEKLVQLQLREQV